ncbi:MAG: glycosyltransferase family protein [Candidatus Methylacidiphilales bacterium]
MAKVLYAVMGNTNGHIMRTLSLISRLPQHEFHIVGGGRVPEVLAEHYPLLRVPVLHSRYKNQKLDLWGTIRQIVLRVLQIPWICIRIHQYVRQWKPDVLVSDREFFTPIYARLTGRTCYSVDHTHIMKCCSFPIPETLRTIHRLTLLNDYLLYDWTRHNFIVSFFQPPLIKRQSTIDEVFGYVVRPELNTVQPSQGDDVFVYLSIPEFPGLIRVLQQLRRKVVCYGAGREGIDGNITYRAFHNTRILEDLAACRYAVINGGHNLISEALHYRKPVLCFPITGQVEQHMNVHFIRELEYGDYTYSKEPSLELFETFDERCEHYQQRIAEHCREGTADLVARLDEVFTAAAQH